jgi:hypothetical protein
VWQLLVGGLLKLVHSEHGARHAATAFSMLTTTVPGLQYLTLLGSKGVDNLIMQLSKSSMEVADIDTAKLLLASAKHLDGAKPPRKK